MRAKPLESIDRESVTVGEEGSGMPELGFGTDGEFVGLVVLMGCLLAVVAANVGGLRIIRHAARHSTEWSRPGRWGEGAGG